MRLKAMAGLTGQVWQRLRLISGASLAALAARFLVEAAAAYGQTRNLRGRSAMSPD